MTAALAVPAGAPAPRPDPGVWWARIARCLADPAEHSLVAVLSDRFPPGTPVDLSALDARGRRPAGWLVDLRYRARDGAVVRLDVAGELSDLPVWFTETHHAGAPIPAVTLAAHVGGDVPPGSLLAPLSRPAAGRLRWQLRSGLVEDLTVEPGSAGIHRLLPVAASALAVLRGWPPLLGDFRATEPVMRRGVERLVGDLPARLL
jgi:hypothetical protein